MYNHPCNRFVAGFLGDANFISGEALGDGKIRSPFGELNVAGCDAPTGSEVAAAIRPERIRILPSDATGTNRIPARLTGRTFLGESCEWQFEAAGGTVDVLEFAPPERRIGDEFLLELPPDGVVLLRG